LHVKRKRTGIGAAVLAVAATAVAGFGTTASSAAPATSKATTISLWSEFTQGGEKKGISDLVSAWGKSNSDIKVNHRPIANDQFFTIIRTGLSSNNPPDVLQYEGYQQTRDFAKAGKLVDLTSWWNKIKKNYDLSAAGTAACTYKGKVYCLPYTFATGWQVYYNADILKENGVAVPKTYEQFLAAADTLKSKGVTPIAFGGKDGWPGEHWWMNFLVQRCGVAKVYSAIQGKGAKFTDACFTQSAADFQNLQTKGYFGDGAASNDYNTATALFQAGKAAFFQTGSWFASGWETQPPKFKAGILSFPRMSGSKFTGDVTGAVTHVFGISTKSKNRDAAIKFLTWMAGKQASTIWAKDGNMALYHGAVPAASPKVIKELWVNVSKGSRALPWVENELPPGVGEDKIYNGTVGLLTGGTTPAQFTQGIQQALDGSKK